MVGRSGSAAYFYRFWLVFTEFDQFWPFFNQIGPVKVPVSVEHWFNRFVQFDLWNTGLLCAELSLDVSLVRYISVSYLTCLHCDAVDSGVSSFNQFIHELSVDSASSSSDDYLSGEEDYDESRFPASPMSQSSRISRASSFTKYERRRIHWIKGLLSWVLWPLTFFLGLPFRIYHLSGFQTSETVLNSENHQSLKVHPIKRSNTIKDHIVHHTTDRRRGVIEVIIKLLFLKCYLVIRSSLLCPSRIYIIVFGPS